jgi:hypothetical protein
VDRMKRRTKRLICWAAMGASLLLLVLLVHVAFVTGQVGGPAVSGMFTALVISYFVSAFAAVHYSEDGWRIQGSTLEWIVSVAINPFLTLVLYLISRRQDREDVIDPRDLERLRNL